MKQSLANSGDGEELIDTIVVGVHSKDPTTALPGMPLVCNMGISLLIILNLEGIDAHSWSKVLWTEVKERS